jgi:predicted phosphodiesterase
VTRATSPTRERRGPSRRAFLGGLAAAGLAGCTRFDATSWLGRAREDVDRRFRESTLEHDAPSPPEVGDEWSALVVSDAHFWEGEVNSSFAGLRAYLRERPVDLLFQLGDLADAGWSGDYDMGLAALESLDVPFYNAIGNHDLFNAGWLQYKLRFGPSVYTLPVGGQTLFVVLDQGSATLGVPQRGWLEDRLAEATAAQIVLLGHYPLWSPTDLGFSQMGSEQEVYDILDLMRRYGVAAHVSGHTHRWASTDFDGAALLTVSALKEASGNRSALRIEGRGAELDFVRVELDDTGGSEAP